MEDGGFREQAVNLDTITMFKILWTCTWIARVYRDMGQSQANAPISDGHIGLHGQVGRNDLFLCYKAMAL